jgi:hypothetical protein
MTTSVSRSYDLSMNMRRRFALDTLGIIVSCLLESCQSNELSQAGGKGQGRYSANARSGYESKLERASQRRVARTDGPREMSAPIPGGGDSAGVEK